MLILSQYLLSLEGQDFYDGKNFFFTISILLILNNVSIMFDIIVKSYLIIFICDNKFLCFITFRSFQSNQHFAKSLYLNEINFCEINFGMDLFSRIPKLKFFA